MKGKKNFIEKEYEQSESYNLSYAWKKLSFLFSKYLKHCIKNVIQTSELCFYEAINKLYYI